MSVLVAARWWGVASFDTFATTIVGVASVYFAVILGMLGTGAFLALILRGLRTRISSRTALIGEENKGDAPDRNADENADA